MDDQTAFEATGASGQVANLPIGYYIIGDAAYVASDRFLTIFHGAHRADINNDNWNYFASQLRIRIEMAFRLMVTRWRILRAPLQMSLPHATATLNAISRLHNYTIDWHPSIINSALIINTTDPQLGYVPSIHESAYANIQAPFQNVSMMRQHLVDQVRLQGLTRPGRN